MEMKNFLNGMKQGSMNWHNAGGNSALGYDADIANFMGYMGKEGLSALGYDADAMGYSSPPPTDPKELRAWLDSQVQSGAMTTFKMRVFYTPGLGVPAPVDVEFFKSAFNTGTFNGSGDLVFTNAGGDTATIKGLTTSQSGATVSIKTLFNLTETEPFTIGFIRMRPKTVDQLELSMNIDQLSQWGASKSNSITPDDYIDPNQFQLLRVDIPFNAHASKKHGFDWTIDIDQTGSGIGMTLFVPKTIDNTKPLSDQSSVRNLNGGMNPGFYVPNHPSGQLSAIAAMAAHPQVKNIIASGVNPGMAASLIKTLNIGK